MKDNKAITLIALVITIIVLLILAGVSIAMLTGDNGVITNATKTQAKNAYSYAEEQMRLANTSVRTAIETNLSNNSSYNATNEDNFNKLVDLVKTDLGFLNLNNKTEGKWKVDSTTKPTITITYTDSNISKKLLNSKYDGKVVGTITIAEQKIEKYDWDCSEQVATKNWTLTDSDSSGSITIGDLITYNEKITEQFYVIEDLGSGDTVKALSKYNLKKDDNKNILKQQDTAGKDNTCVFSNTNYWGNVNGIAYPYTSGANQGKYPNLNDEELYPIGSDNTSIITIAKEYGTSLGVKGRLITLEEVVNLGGSLSEWSTSNCTGTRAFVNTTSYWIGSASGNSTVWRVGGKSLNNYNFDYTYGIRPVVEIPLSTIK